ncbi:MAG: peptidoglycan editing factor PgeF [Candidatus Eremiobacteraeota bacterium]|nr:peptidoglycan editing factor PgeF [Candidatus Eremiobacteraeota bacterium]
MSLFSIMNEPMIQKEKAGIIYFEFAGLGKQDWISHAFTARQGGVSSRPFDTLNTGWVGGDSYENFMENRERVRNALGMFPDELINLEHGKKIIRIGGKGGIPVDKMGGQVADGLVTDLPGVPLCITFADCLPIYIVDPVNHAVGLIHAGWRGILQNIQGESIRVMCKYFGSKPEDLLVGIGPGIQGCCFYVREPQAELFKRAFPQMQDLMVKADNIWYIDLFGICLRTLTGEGVRQENLEVTKLCTSCREDLFFSYRRDKMTGRMAALISIKG